MQFKRGLLSILAIVLGSILMLYGAVKLLGGQFIFHHDWEINGRTTDGPTLVWCFFGYSSVYGRLIGLLEFLPGLLLFFQRTRLMAALILVAVTGNITVMDFCFDFPPVKYFALALTLGCLMLILGDWEKVSRVLGVLLEQAQGPTTMNSRPALLLGRFLQSTVVLVAGVFFVHQLAAGIAPGPEETGITRCEEAGWKRDKLQLLRWQASSWSGFNVSGTVDFEAKDGGNIRHIHMTVWRPHAFTNWRVVGYEEAPLITG